jgi:hypothetical protein
MTTKATPAELWESIIESGSFRNESGFIGRSDLAAVSALAASEVSELRKATGSAKGPLAVPTAREAGSVVTRNDFDKFLSESAAEVKELRAKAPQAKTAPASSAPLRRYEGKTAPAVAAKAALVGTVTAEQFRASIAKPSMARSEWQKLNHSERNAWIAQGGKLHD